MPEWYDAGQTRRAHELYEQVRHWGKDRGDVTVIGGLAVWELVTPPHRMRSRDLDIVLQSPKALRDFRSRFKTWGIQWRRSGRTTFKECRFVQGPDFPPTIDVFTTDSAIGADVFKMQKSRNVEPSIAGQSFVPALEVGLALKIRAVPQRRGQDAPDKRAKDLVDIYNRVFHNLESVPPLALIGAAGQQDRLDAARWIRDAIDRRSEFEQEFRLTDAWLRASGPD